MGIYLEMLREMQATASQTEPTTTPSASVTHAHTEAFLRGVCVVLRCTKSHLLACVCNEHDLTHESLAEYVADGVTPRAFALALKTSGNWVAS